ncbi:MAG: hypothetical protein JEZ06_11200 [Anaerolineaceae bacterium]|nr:hypothetical protein [Anaerolineaceae bacterium]
MNNIQETSNQKDDYEFLWQIYRGAHQIVGILLLGLAIADLIGVVDKYGQETSHLTV